MAVLTIDLSVSELVFDIQNKSYLTGRSRFDGKNDEAVADMKANDDPESISELLRSIQNAYALLKVKLSEYLTTTADKDSKVEVVKDDTAANTALTKYDKDTKLQLYLYVPSNFNMGVKEQIAQACHQYIVNSALAGWFLMTNKADANDYLTLATADLQMIREAINKRVRPVRKSE